MAVRLRLWILVSGRGRLEDDFGNEIVILSDVKSVIYSLLYSTYRRYFCSSHCRVKEVSVSRAEIEKIMIVRD